MALGKSPSGPAHLFGIRTSRTHCIPDSMLIGFAMCFTLELIQTLYAQNDKENGVDFYNSVFPEEAKMCLGFMSFRAPPAASSEDFHFKMLS